MNLQIGSTIGDYQVVGILGSGGMGEVYKVRNVISDRVEAMKVLLPDLASAADLADRFLREIKVQASLDHPNIAALHTAVRVENQLLMLMEFVDGVTLDRRLKDGVLPVRDAVDYVMQVLSALDYAHSRGVIHRDIKPSNMMLTPEGVIKLMDFGIAKASSDHKLTMAGTTLGSLYYMSPEQIQGAASLDGRSDLYSVGVSFYELVTGKRPFDGDSQFAIMSAHLEKAPAPPISLDPRLPQALNDMILMSVSRDPNMRFQTAGAFRNALRSIAAPIPAPAPAPPAPAVNPRPLQPAQPEKPRSKRGLWIAIGALATAAVVVGLIEFGPLKGGKAAPSAVSAPAVTTPPAPAAPVPEQPARSSPPAAAEIPSSAAPVTAEKPKPIHAAQPLPRAQAQEQPVVQQSQPAAIEPAPVQAQPPQPRAASSASSREEIQAVSEQFMLLNTRAGGIRTSLQTLQRSQAARGLNLRGDMQDAASMMDSYMGAANSAIDAGDAASAKSFMDKAERQVEKLEKFLNR
jgi:eukaryotic-like serine/threonine-protein kinase